MKSNNKLFYSLYDHGAKAALGAFAATEPVEGVNIGDVVFQTVNSLVSGDKTRDEWVEGIKVASDRLREALK